MNKIALALLLCLTAPLAFALPGADLPENVGMSNFSTISVSTTPGQIVARNPARNYLFIQNNGAVSAVIKPGSNPSSATNGIVIPANGGIYSPLPALVDAFYSESASGTTTLTIIEAIK